MQAKPGPLRPEGSHQRLDAQDVEHSGQIVGQHVQGHFAPHLRQPLQQEVGCTHAQLDRAKCMVRPCVAR
jgi:hypothetical protein